MLTPDFKDNPSQDPYPQYAQLRESCPVVQMDSAGGLRPFIVTRYEDAKFVLSDPRFSKESRHGREVITAAGLAEYFLAYEEPLHVLEADPPIHTRLRRAFASYFTTRRIAALAPRITQIATGLIDSFAQPGTSGEADFVEVFAGPLPAMVIAEILGIPDHERALFRRWSEDTMLPGDNPTQQEASRKMTEYVTELVGRKRKEPDSALISTVIAEQEKGQELSDAELITGVGVLIVAGHETTVNLLGNGLLALLRSPGQLALLRARPDLIPRAVEEFLRFDGPVERATTRFATEDVQVAGMVIPRGAAVMVALGSADRDTAAFPEPDRLDIEREQRPHLAFGHGIHYCLGAPLARLESQIAFETLLQRLSDLHLTVEPEQIAFRHSPVVRGPSALPIGFRAAD